MLTIMRPYAERKFDLPYVKVSIIIITYEFRVLSVFFIMISKEMETFWQKYYL
jgi:hypothetical protein